MFWYRSSPFWLGPRYRVSAPSTYHYLWHPHHINNVSCLWADWNQDWHFSAEITWTFTSWYCHRWSWSFGVNEGEKTTMINMTVDTWQMVDFELLEMNLKFQDLSGLSRPDYDNMTWSNEGVAATPCWVLPHPTTYAYCPTKCCLGIKIQPLPFWWNPWSHEMLLGSKQSWWTLEDEDSPKARKTNRNNVLLEHNVSSESEEELLCQKHQKSGKLKIDFEFNITRTVTDKYNNKNGSAWNGLLRFVNFCN